MSISFRIWPPSQRTRYAVTKGIVETLSTTSILSKRYGILLNGEANVVAERLEDEAFTAASASSVSADDGGIEILQIYSKQISKRMLDYMKSRSDSPEIASTLDEKSGSTVATTAVDSADHGDGSSMVEEAES